MAELNPDHGLVAGRGAVLIAEPGATPPTLKQLVDFAADYSVLPSGWVPFGDTDPEDLPEFDGDGGDYKTLHTWAFKNAREVQEDPRTNYFTVQAIEFANSTMQLFEGGGDATGENIFWAPGNPAPTKAAVTVALIDESIGKVKGYHAPLMSIRGDEGVTFNRDEWSQIPLRFTELRHPGAKGPHAWIGDGLGVAPATTTA